MKPLHEIAAAVGVENADLSSKAEVLIENLIGQLGRYDLPGHSNHIVEQLRELINYLSINDEVIRRVATEVIEGMTDDGWCGATTSLASEYPTPLMVARRYVALHANEVASVEIHKMQGAINSQRATIAELERLNVDLLRRLGASS